MSASTAERGIFHTGLIPASRERLYRAFIRPEHLKHC